MKPFNLQEALEGKPIVTRDGRKIIECHYFKYINKSLFPIYAIFEGESSTRTFTINGECNYGSESSHDLFMYEEPRTYFVNVYKDLDGVPYTCHKMHDFLFDALTNKDKDVSYVKTIEITIP